MIVKRQVGHEPTTLREPVLCVDLDGTLIASNLLWESLVRLARQHPLLLLLVPLWLLRGKAYLKEQLAARVRLDPATLPYRPDVLAFLREEKARGRFLVLATASNERLARAIAKELDFFDEVVASSGRRNLKGRQKLEALRALW
jgi:phosphoserine phosphatase